MTIGEPDAMTNAGEGAGAATRARQRRIYYVSWALSQFYFIWFGLSVFLGVCVAWTLGFTAVGWGGLVGCILGVMGLNWVLRRMCSELDRREAARAYDRWDEHAAQTARKIADAKRSGAFDRFTESTPGGH